ncbi:MAG TPA: hypothetical protein VHL79_07110 [Ramlibacter sp.]|jgi:hypothetical protein|nr:hypothetical protein [Ramlibacter sp.]
MSTNTSIGPEGMKGGNEDHGNADGLGNKTLGEHATQQPPTGAEGVLDQAGAQVPAGVPGSRPRPGVAKGAEAFPDGPNVESSPWELDAARGKLPKDR